MNRRFMLIGLASPALALLLPACSGPPTMPDYRYRLTVEVETPQGVRTGSSVIEVTNRLAFNMNGGGYSRIYRARGEAVAVDLPGGRTLFALLRGENGANVDWAARIVYDLTTPVPPISDKFGSDRVLQLQNAVANRNAVVVPRLMPFWPDDAAPPAYPLLVTFGDLRDPKSVERVMPNDLANNFGESVKLRRITVQITDDPVTTGIGRRLGWLGQYPEPRLNPTHSPTDYSISATLEHGDFRKGTEQ
jgi:hypothetical protein